MDTLETYIDRLRHGPNHRSVLKGDETTDPYFANPKIYGGGSHAPNVNDLRSYWATISSDDTYPPSKTLRNSSSTAATPASSGATSKLPFQPFVFDYLAWGVRPTNYFPNVGLRCPSLLCWARRNTECGRRCPCYEDDKRRWYKGVGVLRTFAGSREERTLLRRRD